MWETEQQTDIEATDIRLLKEWLPKISGEYRAYIKGASRALLYVQETFGNVIEQALLSKEGYHGN